MEFPKPYLSWRKGGSKFTSDRNLMRKPGYQPGLGLGRNEDGILDPVILEARI